MKRQIYLDNASTTRVYEEVVKVMNKVMLEDYGNPSSLHEMGEKARKLIDEARKKIACEIGAKTHEIVFTSGATESNNLAIQGLLKNKLEKKKKIILSAIEHPAVKEVVLEFEKFGIKVVEIGVNSQGKLDLVELEKQIDNTTALVSIIHANNIIGIVQDLEEIGKICKRKGVFFHTDATQSFGKLKIDVRKNNIDLLSASAHKIGGPKGIGFLYIREGINLEPFLYGGGQEKGIRSGTENVSGIVGFAKALELIKKTNKEKVLKIKEKLSKGLAEYGFKINSSKDGLFNILHVSLKGYDGEYLMYQLSTKGIYISVGSACDSKRRKEDSVLKSIGLNKAEIKGSLRISLSEEINEKDIDYVLKSFKGLILK